MFLTGLNQEQVDCLWKCLATDPASSDDCLSWFLNQAKSKDHHALGLETFRHIFLEKVVVLWECKHVFVRGMEGVGRCSVGALLG